MIATEGSHWPHTRLGSPANSLDASGGWRSSPRGKESERMASRRELGSLWY
ncbi:MAG: hypothetical protein KME26_26070 [Oscillatoria princeps RMCB-10]|nr:hypothetical protein [Oscillatoria princeps RMCB-10]